MVPQKPVDIMLLLFNQDFFPFDIKGSIMLDWSYGDLTNKILLKGVNVISSITNHEN